MNDDVQPRKSLRFRGRSFMALVFAPEPPLDDWLHELDEWSKRSPGYFVGRPIILDVTALPLDKAGLASLIGNLSERDIRIMGVEGTKASWLGLGMPPLINGGRQSGATDLSEPPTAQAEVAEKAQTTEKVENSAGIEKREKVALLSNVPSKAPGQPVPSMVRRQPGPLRPVGDLLAR